MFSHFTPGESFISPSPLQSLLTPAIVLATLFSLPYTSHEIFTHIRKIDLRYKSKTYKLLRLLAECVLAALWFLSLIMGAAVANTTLGNKNAAVNTVAILASACWVIEIVLFSGSVLLVLVQTFRRWRAEDPKAVLAGYPEQGYEYR